MLVPMSDSSIVIPPAQLGVVVIGRNEGRHLLDAFGSVGEQAGAAVYADSDSTDDSVALVREHFPAVEIVQMRASERRLSPARGRN